MKITLSVTKEELLDLLSKATGSRITSYSIVKEKKTPTLHSNIVQDMRFKFGSDYFTKPDGAFGPAERKIEAIKFLRELALKHANGMGLAEAKEAIEKWSKWIECVKNEGIIPAYNRF